MKALVLGMLVLLSNTQVQDTVTLLPHSLGVKYVWELTQVEPVLGINLRQEAHNTYSFDTYTELDDGTIDKYSARSGYKVKGEIYAGLNMPLLESLSIYVAPSLVLTNQGCTSLYQNDERFYHRCRSRFDAGLVGGVVFSYKKILLDAGYSTSYRGLSIGAGWRF